jgi:hypothetical protein
MPSAVGWAVNNPALHRNPQINLQKSDYASPWLKQDKFKLVHSGYIGIQATSGFTTLPSFC